MMTYELDDTEKAALLNQVADRARADLNEGKPLTEMRQAEWHTRQTVPGSSRSIFNSEGKLIANVVDEQSAMAILRDRKAVPLLADALRLLLAMDNCNYDLETMRQSGLCIQVEAALKAAEVKQ